MLLRFANISLLCAFCVLSFHTICFMSEEELNVYGDKEMDMNKPTIGWRGLLDDYQALHQCCSVLTGVL